MALIYLNLLLLKKLVYKPIFQTGLRLTFTL